MTLPLRMPFPPMEALSVDEIPVGKEWQYEPKWDGFRCLVFRDGGKVELQSKSGRSMTRYFPEAGGGIERARNRKNSCLTARSSFRTAASFSFDALLQRIHPAASRVQRLAGETPALFILFDILVDGRRRMRSSGETLAERRRTRWKPFARKYGRGAPAATVVAGDDAACRRQAWLKRAGPTLDGVIAKRRDLVYWSGDRSGMQKIKNYRSADCVVGGFRYNEGKPVVGSLLLGLYDKKGLLASRRLHRINQARGKVGADQEARTPDRAARLHRQRAGRSEPLVDGKIGRMGSRSSQSSWSRSATTTFPVSASAMARGCCAGGRTRRRGNARSNSSGAGRAIWLRC